MGWILRVGLCLALGAACGKKKDERSGAAGGGVDAGDGYTVVALTVDGGLSVQAILSEPDGGASRPAAIYIHGKEIEEQGYEGAKAAGYDVADFTRALADAGYVGLAPVRPGGRSYAEYDAVHFQAIDFLRTRAGVDASRVFVIGFSKGGFVTLRLAVQNDTNVRAIVFMSPAPGEPPDNWPEWHNDANLQQIDKPVYVTLGANEPNPTIVSNVGQLISDLQRLGKSVQSKTDFPGDHQWFHQVRAEYWPQILSFLGSQ